MGGIVHSSDDSLGDTTSSGDYCGMIVVMMGGDDFSLFLDEDEEKYKLVLKSLSKTKLHNWVSVVRENVTWTHFGIFCLFDNVPKAGYISEGGGE